MSAGKGSAPRNIGPKFRENWDAIFRKPKKLGTKLAPSRDQVGTKSRRTVSPHP